MCNKQCRMSTWYWKNHIGIRKQHLINFHEPTSGVHVSQADPGGRSTVSGPSPWQAECPFFLKAMCPFRLTEVPSKNHMPYQRGCDSPFCQLSPLWLMTKVPFTSLISAHARRCEWQILLPDALFDDRKEKCPFWMIEKGTLLQNCG